MTTITIKVVDEQDAAQLLDSLSKHNQITWYSDTHVSEMKVDVKKKEVTVFKSKQNYPRLRL